MDILPFTYKNNNIRTFRDKNDKIWFIAKDVANILGFASKSAMSNAFKDLDEDELSSFKMNSDGQIREFKTVSESGLYSLIIRSRKAVAKPFQKWLTGEVLPSIRKTGSYSLDKVEEKPQINLSEIIKDSKEVLELIHLFENEKTLSLFQLDSFMKKYREFSPLELLGINFENSYFIPTELGKIVGKSPVETNLILAKKGFQFRENGVWKLTEKGKPFAISFQNGNFVQIKWKLESLV